MNISHPQNRYYFVNFYQDCSEETSIYLRRESLNSRVMALKELTLFKKNVYF